VLGSAFFGSPMTLSQFTTVDYKKSLFDDFSLNIVWGEIVNGLCVKILGISRWRRSDVANARANKQVRTKIGRIISVPDHATDTSLFCLPVQTNGADGFKLALVLISRKVKGADARIVHTRHDEIIVKSRLPWRLKWLESSYLYSPIIFAFINHKALKTIRFPD
jgi:hypothetical protein